MLIDDAIRNFSAGDPMLTQMEDVIAALGQGQLHMNDGTRFLIELYRLRPQPQMTGLRETLAAAIVDAVRQSQPNGTLDQGMLRTFAREDDGLFQQADFVSFLRRAGCARPPAVESTPDLQGLPLEVLPIIAGHLGNDVADLDRVSRRLRANFRDADARRFDLSGCEDFNSPGRIPAADRPNITDLPALDAYQLDFDLSEFSRLERLDVNFAETIATLDHLDKLRQLPPSIRLLSIHLGERVYEHLYEPGTYLTELPKTTTSLSMTLSRSDLEDRRKRREIFKDLSALPNVRELDLLFERIDSPLDVFRSLSRLAKLPQELTKLKLWFIRTPLEPRVANKIPRTVTHLVVDRPSDLRDVLPDFSLLKSIDCRLRVGDYPQLALECESLWQVPRRANISIKFPASPIIDQRGNCLLGRLRGRVKSLDLRDARPSGFGAERQSANVLHRNLGRFPATTRIMLPHWARID